MTSPPSDTARSAKTPFADCAGIAAFAIVGVLWVIFAAEEPLHIDELRQTRAYAGGPEQWVGTSWGMNQPPLEITLGAIWRRLFGASDYAERLFPVIVGLLSLILLARLAIRFSGKKLAAPIAILAYGLSPLVFRTTALMRPYAIPTFFSLLFLTTLIDLRDRGPSRLRITSAVVGGAGLLLSHALIPVLVAGVAVLGLFAMKARKQPDSSGAALARRIALGVTLLGLLMPIALRFKNPTFFESPVAYSLSDRLVDAVELTTTAARSNFGWALLPLVLSLVLLMIPSFRPQRGELWWFIALIGIPVGVSAVFFVTVAPGYPYPDRYLHDIMLSGAIGLGLVGSRWETRDRRPWQGLAFGAIGLAVAGSFVTLSIPAFQHEVTTERFLDWAEGTDLIMEHLDSDVVILFEPLVPFPSYQSLFYGQPRYLPDSYVVRMSRLIVDSGHMLGDGPIAVLLVGSQASTIAPPGWRIEQSGIWQLLIPPPAIENDAVAVLEELEAAITDDLYDLVLRMHIAIALAERGDIEEAYSTLEAIDRPAGNDPQQLYDRYTSKVQERIALLQP
ncbi:MAG: glycosyltransferase family 39 protein [Acidimicrobiia bacterium]|nr:glycosyltransferase family 39 protein [Acidimicrobiia bacterium]